MTPEEMQQELAARANEQPARREAALRREMDRLKGRSKGTVLRESMTKVTTELFVIRIWRQENHSFQVDRSALRREVIALAKSIADPVQLATAVLYLTNVNAVEVLDMAGNGEVLYKCDHVTIDGKEIAII